MKHIALSTAVLATFFIAAPSYAQQDQRLKDIVKEVDGSIKLAQESQQRIDSTQTETDKLFTEYKQLLKVNAGLRAYNVQQEKEIERQEEEIAKIQEAIAGIDEVKRQITPLMLDMINDLENFIELDLPFQKEDRIERIATLRDAMEDPNVNDPERFRVILDAYKAEVTYGRTINAYEGELDSGAIVNFVRIGRVGFYYQTKDSKTTAAWNKNSGEWETLDAANATSVRQLIRMANRQVQQDIVVLPILAAEAK